MKRDMDVIRQIVLAVRESERAVNGVDGVDPAVFAEHVRLLDEAGLVTAAVQVVQQRTTAAIAWRLTWAGQDFADAIKEDTLWRKAKDNVIKPTGSWTFGVLLDYLKAEITRGLPSLPL
ncbi:DUF2513 domain-containing protein [Paracidovorax anthurii]|uniref:Uncharacterized protein DUF2513 n=1 Tax=Paracidovorax anthurii TaxID=78229 RepID=A0A328ZL19_9BURK|nr:DUF2513 domain-containing protein [Paracidovorax anthurii]RAR86085.1 uncharacterized protein DUF2513 [Paracidovorax anthurii]